ncbi:MAG: TolC family protein [Deltaproteobacteria bacterium]|nr:TolC family protein [Deltaproteobacteria bacterium]
MTRIGIGMHWLVAPLVGCLGMAADPAASQEIASRDMAARHDALDADTAVRMALETDPRLAAMELEAAAGRAEAAFGGRWENPSLAVEWEEFGLARPMWRRSELTVLLEQPIPLGEAGAAERQLAATRAARTESRRRLARVSLAVQVREAHLAALAEQERIDLLVESLAVAGQVRDAVRAAIDAGSSAPADEHLATAEYRAEELARRRAEARLAMRKEHLAAFWGAEGDCIGRLVGSLDPPGPSAPVRPSTLDPEAALALVPGAALMRERRAALELEQARRIPDLTLIGGVRGIEGFGEQAFVAGLSVPLPAWNRNRAGIEAAALQVRRAAALVRMEEREWRRQIGELEAAIHQARLDHDGIRDGVLPELEAGFKATLEAFRGGDASSLDVLDAQRRVLAVRIQMLDSAEQLLAARIRLDSLLLQSGAAIPRNDSDATAGSTPTRDAPSTAPSPEEGR